MSVAAFFFLIGKVLPKSSNFQISNFKNEVILKVFNHQKWEGGGGGREVFKLPDYVYLVFRMLEDLFFISG
jgi:hypothetical protein